MQNSIGDVHFSVFDRKYPFWVNLVQKLKLLVYTEIWYLEKFKYAEYKGDVQFSFLT